MVGQTDRLGPLQVGVAGDRSLDVRLGQGQQHPLEAAQLLPDGIDLTAQPEAGVGAHLIVAGTGGVQLLA